MTVVNVSKRMREEAYLKKGENNKFKVSKEAEKEYADRINTAFEINMQLLCEIAKKDGRKTILDRDVMMLFSRRDVTTEEKQ